MTNEALENLSLPEETVGEDPPEEKTMRIHSGRSPRNMIRMPYYC